MDTKVSAVYENGIFRPTRPVPALANGTSVLLTVQPMGETGREGDQRSLTPKELRDLIRSKNPEPDDLSEQLWEELHKGLQVALVLGKAAARKTITAAEAAQGYADILNDAPVLHQSRVFVDTRLFNSLSTPARRLRLPLFGAGLRPKIATSVQHVRIEVPDLR